MSQESLLKNTSFLGGGNRFTLPKCVLCRHCMESETEIKCKTFPNGVPDEVLEAPYEEECKPGVKFEEMK
jgi:hypothetical protein